MNKTKKYTRETGKDRKVAVNLRLSPSMKAKAEKIAIRRGVSLAEYIRYALVITMDQEDQV